MHIIIRKAVERDTEQVWKLMHHLAVFEKYIGSFAITPAIVVEKGFAKSPPDFYCLVAEHAETDTIVGMLVYYFLNYTAQNRPAIYMKELYVNENYRGEKIGKRLMKELAQVAKENNCSTIKWGVAPWNAAGIHFYEKLGATENNEWLQYEMNESSFTSLLEK